MHYIHPSSLLRLSSNLLVTAAMAFSVASAQQPEQLLNRVADTFQTQNWKTAGDTRVVADIEATDAGMELMIPFSGKGFEYYRMEPVEPITVPGRLGEVSFRIHMSDPGAAVQLLITDGHGHGRDVDVRGATKGEWSVATVAIPDDMVQPVSIRGLLFHNYGTRTKKTDVTIGLADLTVQTDLSKADAATGRYLEWKPDPKAEDSKVPPETPLLIANFGTTRPGNFFAGDEPELILSVRNWRVEPAELRAELEVTDEAGEVVYRDSRKVSVEGTDSLRWKPTIDSYGPYRASLNVVRTGDAPHVLNMRLAKAPAQPELSEAEKKASPYGMNYHAGHGLLLEPFRGAGIVWFRDYAFAWNWLKRAKGDNHSFSGWPGYPGIIKAYQDVGAMLMPCMAGAIPHPEIVNGEVQNTPPPDRDWASHLVSVLLGFPHIEYWELDNEYELDHEIRRAEEMMDWEHYERYHKRFSEIVAVMGQGELKSVENGRAGIFPDLVAKAVDNGSFAALDVINIHRYCGVDAPEENVRNFNTGGLGQTASSYYDQLRETVAAANRDGKDREVFITEFGWDTLAGQVVTEAQQAAYLARAYMMHAAAGLDKSFWYWHFDSPNPSAFFDGCGLMDHNREPKPSLAAMAGLTSLLPQLDYVGTFNAGPGTLGYVFRQDGQLVAAAWRIREGGDPISFDFGPGAKLRDLYGNALPGTRAVLGIAPVYAVGVAEGSTPMKQAAYRIASEEYMPTTSGEQARVRVLVNNLRGEVINGELKIRLPDGWTGSDQIVSVAAGERSEVVIPVDVPNGVPTGVYPMEVAVHEEGATAPVTILRLEANVRQPFYLSVSDLSVETGVSEVTATVENQSNSVKSPEVSLALPSTWKAVSEPVVIEGLKPGESRAVTLQLDWNADLPEGQKAEVVVSTDRVRVAEPIIPPVMRIRRLDADRAWFGADAERWPEANRLPDWMLGSTYGEPRADVAVGWTEEGLWFGWKVDESKVYVTDPRSFWKGDVLEIFIDTDDDKAATSYGKGDHQFWIMAQPESNDVFLGQWKRGDEIADTRQDIEAVKGAAARTENGYVMEFLIPWSEIEGGQPGEGVRIGLNPT
ncbi:MAG: NEW3 domain-containing protein, partial [Kiritimatiellae bacterium]|nr:NEW3 domain-containing protein [Kiritimatiellia bacterium]